jgi:carbamoyl-phosphate synthase large subunit
VDIVGAFRRAGATAVAADANPLAPALYHADEHALVPRVDDPDYIPALRALVEQHDIRLIVPLTDLDHGVLSRAKDELGAVVLLPKPEVVDALADKWLAHLLFVERGIGSPDTWLPADVPDDVAFPVLVKARRGFGSRGIYRCADRHELEFFLGYSKEDSMVQAACRGEEFSIDLFCDLESRCLNAVPRTMIESKGGESIKGMTLADPELIEVGRFVSETIGLVGPANVQCFREPDGSHRVTDINPRFGGAFPLPTAAGSRYPELALSLAAGERIEPRLGDFRAGLYMTRFFSELVLSADADGSLQPFAEELPEPLAGPLSPSPSSPRPRHAAARAMCRATSARRRRSTATVSRCRRSAGPSASSSPSSTATAASASAVPPCACGDAPHAPTVAARRRSSSRSGARCT